MYPNSTSTISVISLGTEFQSWRYTNFNYTIPLSISLKLLFYMQKNYLIPVATKAIVSILAYIEHSIKCLN